MSSISPHTGSCCPPGSLAATGGGPVLDPALDAGPTGAAPAGVAATGPSDLPPPPSGAGGMPGTGAPTGFDAAPVTGGGPVYLPAPMDVAGGPGSGAVEPGSSTVSVSGGGPEVTAESIIAGGGPGGAPVLTGAAGIPNAAIAGPASVPQPLPGWNANYGDAFAKAFDQAGVDPATASAALHSLAAMGASADELDQTLQYLQTEDGASLAPYMADELAGQAPSYARIGMDAPPVETKGTSPNNPQIDPKTGQPITPGADGQPTAVGQTEDGGIQMSDGSITYEDGSVIQPDGTMVAPDGSTLTPDGVLTRPDGTTSQIDMETGQEIDPATGQPIVDPAIDPETGLPIDPNATGAPGEPPADGGTPWGKIALFGLAGAAVIGGGIYAYKHRPRATGITDPEADPARAAHTAQAAEPARAPSEPVDLRHAVRDARAAQAADAAAGTPRTNPARATPNAAASFRERFAQNRAAILGEADPTRTPAAGVREAPRVTPTSAQARAAAIREAMGEYREKGSVPFTERFGHTMPTGRHNIQGAHRIDRAATARAAESVETLAYRDAVKNLGKNAASQGVDNLSDDAGRSLIRSVVSVANHAR